MLQARLKRDDSPVGAFDAPSSQVKHVTCSSQHPTATLTHTAASDDKSVVSATWSAPAGVDADEVYFVATVAKSFGEYWVGIRAQGEEGSDAEPENEAGHVQAMAGLVAATAVAKLVL